MNSIPYYYIILLVILVIIIMIVISSISCNTKEEIEVVKSKNLQVKDNKIITSVVKNVTQNNCYILDTTSINKNSGYSISGKFTNSHITLYDFEENICYSKNLNGYLNITLASNKSILPSLYKLSKYKNTTISLTEGEKYRIVIDKFEDIKTKKIEANYDIILNEFSQENSRTINLIGFTEYDLNRYSVKFIENIKEMKAKNTEKNFSRVYPINTTSFEEWSFRGEGKYLITNVENLYNYKIKFINPNKEDISSISSSENPNIKFTVVENPNLIITNSDYVKENKDINTEYIDFITSPNNLIDIYINGKKHNKINYTYSINNKILIYRI
jgi:hypothetical protein